MRTVTEDILGEFGFRVVWKVEDTWANLKAYEITVREGGAPLFDRAGAQCLPDPVADSKQAEVYLSGFVKWDGCSELDQGCPHWCGPVGYKKHIALLTYIYRRAFELMGRGEWESWDGAEYPQ